jgi:hypothetical protein
MSFGQPCHLFNNKLMPLIEDCNQKLPVRMLLCFWMKIMRTGREGYLFRDVLSLCNARFHLRNTIAKGWRVNTMGSRSFIVATSLLLTAEVGTGAPVRPYVAILRRGLLGLAAGVLAGCVSDPTPHYYPPQAATRGYYPAQPVPPDYPPQAATRGYYPAQPVPPDYPPQAGPHGYYPLQTVPPDYPPQAGARGYYPAQPVSPDYPPQAGPHGYYPPQTVPPDYPAQPAPPTYSLPPTGPY